MPIGNRDRGAIQDESGNDFQGISTGEWEFSAKQQDGPNIIVIFADDHGYTDLGVHDYDKYVRTSIPRATGCTEVQSYSHSSSKLLP